MQRSRQFLRRSSALIATLAAPMALTACDQAPGRTTSVAYRASSVAATAIATDVGECAIGYGAEHAFHDCTG